MRKIVLVIPAVLAIFTGVSAKSFICRVPHQNCKELKIEAKNLAEAKKEALNQLSKRCNTLKLEDINCTQSQEKSKKESLNMMQMDTVSDKKVMAMNAHPILVRPKIKISKYNFSSAPDLSGEEYNSFSDNSFKDPLTSPLSTFSVDVDTASYGIVRRYIMQNSSFPPKGAVRVEEMINYFNYDYKEPNSSAPLAISSKVGDAIWDKNGTKVLQIGLRAKSIDSSKLPPSNLVFLIDVSGSMGAPNKLPLLKRAFKLLVNQLRTVDTVSIVVYAGSSGVVINGVRGDKNQKILDAIDNLRAGGSTAGGQGIRLAYKIAKENFIKGGNNRVVLATDGDFNVGISSQDQLVDLIQKYRDSGIYLSILGFGMGNFKDSKMEKLADKGNGNYAYIDNLLEAKKVLVKQMSGTLFTVAKDVKVQVEFNPKFVKKYRLIGYVNRKMANEDFKNDKKDASEVGVGHRVTVLYELKLKQNSNKIQSPLKYQSTNLSESAKTQELATIKLRYKPLDSNSSKLISHIAKIDADEIKRDDFLFAQAVASFGMILRDSQYKGDITLDRVVEVAKDAKGSDRDGYRADFIRVVEKASLLKRTK